jgi:hypothetical protein
MKKYETNYSPIVNDFENDLAAITADRVFALPNLADRVRHDGKYTRIVDLKPGLYLDPLVIGSRTVRANFGFDLKPGRRLSHEDSRHKVYFGNLASPDINAPVAVKTMANFDLGELAMTQLFHQEGLPTFKPFGYLVAAPDPSAKGTARGHMMTRYQTGVEPIASMDWRDLTEDEKWLHVGFATSVMAILNPNLLFHTDLYFRNVTIDNRGEIIIPDLEHTVSLRGLLGALRPSANSQNRDALIKQIAVKLNAEFATVMKSVDEYVFATRRPRIKDPKQKFNLVRENVYDRYEAEVRSSNTEYVELLLEAFALILAKKKEETRRHSTPPKT